MPRTLFRKAPRTTAALLLLFTPILLAVVEAQDGAKTVADGVYTDAQAVRGAASFEATCSGCHRVDLRGGANGPPLLGESFAKHFADADLKALYARITTTMPRGNPASLDENVYLDILAHVLRENGFPAGPADLTSDSVSGVRMLPGRPKAPDPVGNFSYVAVIGCLTKGPQNSWLLTAASEPASAAVGASQPATVKDAPPGTRVFHLLDAMAYGPESKAGRRLVVRGLLIRLPDQDRITISSLELLESACAP